MKHIGFAALAVALLSSTAVRGADILGNGSLKDSPSLSGTRINWTGVYVGGQVGYGNANHNIRETESLSNKAFCQSGKLVGSTCETKAAEPAKCLDPKGEWDGTEADCNVGKYTAPKPAVTNDALFVAENALAESAFGFLDGLNSSGVFGGGTVGADIQRGNFLVGGFFDYNWSGLKTTVGGTGSPDIDIIEEGNSWVAAARAGYLFGEDRRALLYVLGGWGQTDVEFGGQKDIKFKGFVAGAGAEYALSQNIFLGLEYQHFFGSEETIASSSITEGPFTYSSKTTDEMDTDKVMVKLKAKTGFGLPDLN